ncbi:hypothetical protein CK203_025259 [Vitis vinifera]|uniref:Uncharacterized protein n=1 Tax=Vitis vinifera TaxID=29760 RepID=A0A438JES3_VITVI|nr:hypothetical protein CK203_025259 [Vitis vinifera]
MGGSPVGGGRNGKKAKNREKMEMQGSGRTAGGLEGQDGAGRAWRGVRSGRKVSHAPSLRRRVGDSPEEKSGAWESVRCRSSENFAGKGCRRGGDPTAMRLSGVVREENEGTGVKHGHWTCISFGGLRIRRLHSLNQALLGNWLWRFSVEHESLWRKIICGKFGKVEGGWTTKVWRESFGMSLCKDIRKGWEEFNAKTSIRIRNVAESWKREGDEGGCWEVHFRRPFQDWEEEEEAWGSRALLKTCFFAWEAVWGKILTVDTLMKRG